MARPSWAACCAIGLALVLESEVGWAAITQVNGLVVPAYPNRLQAGLNGSGDENVNAVLDARLSPEVFAVPIEADGSYRTVVFRDILEGAGYENTFGWYNVSDPTSLYPVLECGDEPGTERAVDFQAEYEAGNFLGGFVGFFMISPGQQGCGDLNRCPAPPSCEQPAFVVYTENQLNGDGNYVHYLLYESQADPLAYYFGFEDLWRGGDNDFEDMLIRVTGLVKPCEPSAEVCDGLDNNCDGLIDNDPVDAGLECPAAPDYSPGVGICTTGVLVCVDGELECRGAVGPRPELCNGVDDDCNGLIDDSPGDSWIDQPCSESWGEVGVCGAGRYQCISGSQACVGEQGPRLEVCNGLDDDCDGVVDGSVVTVPPAPCEEDRDCDASAPWCLVSTVTGSKVCAAGPADAVGNCPVAGSQCAGIRVCEAGAIVCRPTGGTEEVCNLADDDCDGLVDEGDPGGGGQCASDDEYRQAKLDRIGVCQPGVLHCLGGELRCVGERGPSPEICDGLDNDCDGVADQAAPCPDPNSICVEGRCAPPCGSGEFACPLGLVCKKGYCVKADFETEATAGAAGAAGSTGEPPTAGGKSAAGAPSHGGASAVVKGGSEPGSLVGGRTDDFTWGLVTGGGGCAVSGAGGRMSGRSLWLAAILGAALRQRRGSRRGRA